MCIRDSHGNGLTSLYSHCSGLAVQEGDTVTAGQVIAYVGNSGNSTGYHLHMEVEQNGVVQDPLTYLQADTAESTPQLEPAS